LNENEKVFLALDKNFRINNKDWRKEEIMLNLEDILYSERRRRRTGER
jgi:hypothetical protein